ncbi:hypothetical protein BDN67DRAFT_798461 [Paxillus ammoniavirescens]|nr:hypothetical protein BDN67DRAFT_798461 [Paxillus ammoniavirescens]
MFPGCTFHVSIARHAQLPHTAIMRIARWRTRKNQGFAKDVVAVDFTASACMECCNVELTLSCYSYKKVFTIFSHRDGLSCFHRIASSILPAFGTPSRAPSELELATHQLVTIEITSTLCASFHELSCEMAQPVVELFEAYGTLSNPSNLLSNKGAACPSYRPLPSWAWGLTLSRSLNHVVREAYSNVHSPIPRML